MIDALGDQVQFLPAYLSGHLRLTLLTLFLGSALSITLGILACRSPRTQAAALVAASVVQTIPGLALLAMGYGVVRRWR